MLIKNGLLIDPVNNIEEITTIQVTDKKVTAIDCHIEARENEHIIDAKGCWVMPGAIDLHVHLREPGFTHKGDIESETRAAAKGGITTVCAMPNTRPVVDRKEIVEQIYAIAKEKASVNVLQFGAVTKGQEGKELADIEAMKKAGICGLSEDGRTVMNSQILRDGMEKGLELGLSMFSHCEDEPLARGCMNEGKISKKLGLIGIPKEAEDIIAARDILLSKLTGCPIHLCHVSTKHSAQLIKFYKELGLKVTAEVCAHHFSLSEEVIDGSNTFAKMNPPLREQVDVDFLKQAIKDDVIDALATDHAPHTTQEKNQPFSQAPNGIIGFETLIPLAITELYEQDYVTKKQLVEKLSANPAKILNIDKGHLSLGAQADITIIDPEAKYIFAKEELASKSENTPFIGKEMTGRVVTTIVDGQVRYQF